MRAESAVKIALAAGRWAALIGAGLVLWMLGLAARCQRPELTGRRDGLRR